MIKRIKADLKEGDIVEIIGHSEPLYIFHNSELVKITPLEYNICVDKVPNERWFAIFQHKHSAKPAGW